MMSDLKIRYDADVSDLTTFGVASRAAALVEWRSESDLRRVIEDKGLPRPLKVIGGGSNLLFTGKFSGTILYRTGEPRVEIDGLNLRADANAVLDDLCELVAVMGLRGMENLSGIPGTLGGALVQNAGAYGAETGELLESATLFDLQSGETFEIDRDRMGYSYRHSVLKDTPDSYVILHATLRLRPADSPARIDYGNLREALGGQEPTPMAVRCAVMLTRDAKLPHPDAVGSAGSFFRNPEVGADKLCDDMPRYDLGGGRYKVPAAWLIDHAGLKGATAGGASTWPQQPLVIVNTDGRATAADIIALEQKIINAVKERYDINLIPEVEHL